MILLFGKVFFRVFFDWLLKVYGTQLMIYADLNALLTLTVYFFSITFHLSIHMSDVWLHCVCNQSVEKNTVLKKKRSEKLFFLRCFHTLHRMRCFTYGRHFLWLRMAFELIENILSYFQISFRCSACSLSQSQTKHYAAKMSFISFWSTIFSCRRSVFHFKRGVYLNDKFSDKWIT